MQKIIAVATLALGLLISNGAKAGIPVIDAGSIAQQIQQVAAWAQQYLQMTQQLQQLEAQITAITGNRGLGNLLNDATAQAARRSLPTAGQEVMDLMAGTGTYGSYANQIQTILSATSNLSNSDFGTSTAAKQYDESLRRAATNNALSVQAYTDATQRLGNLEDLIGQISNTQDPKDIAELQARIAAENGLIQNEHAKLQAMQMLMASQQQLQATKARQTSIRMGGNINNVPHVTLSK